MEVMAVEDSAAVKDSAAAKDSEAEVAAVAEDWGGPVAEDSYFSEWAQKFQLQ